MGMACCDGWCTVCSHEHGRIVLFYAYVRRTLLCRCRARSTRMGSSCCLVSRISVTIRTFSLYLLIAIRITGWSNWLVQITGAPSVNYGTSAMILAAASIYHPSYIPSDYQVFLLASFLMIIHACMSSLPTKWLAKTNSFGSTFNMIALAVVIIMIPAATNRTEQGLPKFTSSKEVWGTIANGTDWPDGIAVLMSFIAVLWTMSGYDAPFHLAEECSNANIAAPRAIVMTSTFGGIFGWLLQLVVAYTVIDISAVIESDLGQPFAAYLVQVLPQKVAVAILALTIIAGFFMGQGCMIAASRVTFAYARDGCFPLSKYWAHVNTKTRTPVNAVWANTVIGILMLLLIFGGTVSVSQSKYTIGNSIANKIATRLVLFSRLVPSPLKSLSLHPLSSVSSLSAIDSVLVHGIWADSACPVE